MRRRCPQAAVATEKRRASLPGCMGGCDCGNIGFILLPFPYCNTQFFAASVSFALSSWSRASV
jgi:hypothetical protein